MERIPKTITHYRVADHNLGVIEVEFTHKATVKDDSGDCDIFHADCPYGYNDRGITVSYQRFKAHGYHASYKQASDQCISNQREEVYSTGRSFRNAQSLLNDLENHCPIITPNKE